MSDATFDKGGWLQPGYVLAHNGTGDALRVSPPPVGQREVTDVAARLDKLRADVAEVMRRSTLRSKVLPLIDQAKADLTQRFSWSYKEGYG